MIYAPLRSPAGAIAKPVPANRSVAQTTKSAAVRWRTPKSPVVMAFRKKMASEEAREQYRRRGRIVEFCHAWIKSSNWVCRQFHVRGLKKVQMSGNAVGLPHLQLCSIGSG